MWIGRLGGEWRGRARDIALVESLAQDIGYAVRQLRRAPGFTAAVLANLAIGIGATVAIFSVVYGVLLRPLPYPTRDRLVRLSEEHPGARTPLTAQISNLTFSAWTIGGLRTLDRLAAYREDAYLVDFAGEPLLVSGADVSPDLLSLLGAVPAVGRFFAPDEATEGFDRVLVLSDRLWRRRFRSDPGVIDRQIRVWGEPYTIIGVARPDLAFPDADTELWTPFVMPRRAGTAENPHVIVFRALGLLKPGTTIAQAAAEGTAAARTAAVAFGSNVAFGVGGAPIVRVLPIREAMTSVVRPALWLLSAGIGLVLLAVSANVVVLFLLRGASRQREIAVRAAIGAGTTRILRQLLTESAMLVTLGGICGVAVAWGLVRIVLAIAPADFPRVDAIHVDGMALAFAAVITVLTGTASSLWPAFRSARGDLAAALRGGAGESTSGFGAMPAQKVRSTLLAAEAAFAVLLMVIAALLARSFATIVHVEPGYTPEGVLAATVYLPGGDAATGRRAALMWEMLERLRARPDVTMAGAANMTPLDPAIVLAGFPVPREIGNEDATLRFAQALRYTVTPGYAEALKLRLIEGRLFADADLCPGVHSLIVNEEFARLYLPRHPTSRRFTWAGEPLEIVGVVTNVLKNGYEQPPQAEVYVPLRPGDPVWGGIRIMTRLGGDANTVALAIRGIVRQLAPDAAVEIEPLTARVAASVAKPRFASLAMLSYAGFALTLASLGLYGVLSYGVSRRRRELGVRVALGASRGALMQLVLREGLAVTGIGLAVGLAVAVATTHLLKGLLFGVTAVDIVAFTAAPVLLAIVAVGASLLPAYRAASIDPLDALRQ